MNIFNVFKNKPTATEAAPKEPSAQAEVIPLHTQTQNENLSFEPFRSFELKIKIKSLGAEIRLIHDEEIKLKAAARKAGDRFPDTAKHFRDSFWSLREHREGLTDDTRAANLAYGFLRGKSYLSMEPKRYSDPAWGSIERMVLKYGARHGDRKLKQSFEQWKQAAGEKASRS